MSSVRTSSAGGCGGGAEIPLTRGLVALVDASDVEWLSEIDWAARPDGRTNYAIARLGRRTITMHRLVAGARRGQVVDHINGNGLDNRRANLRCCAQRDNSRNRQAHRGSASGLKGAHRHGSRWRAIVTVNGAQRFVGAYSTAIEAAVAYDTAASKLFGEFARLNFHPDRDWLLPKVTVMDL